MQSVDWNHKTLLNSHKQTCDILYHLVLAWVVSPFVTLLSFTQFLTLSNQKMQRSKKWSQFRIPLIIDATMSSLHISFKRLFRTRKQQGNEISQDSPSTRIRSFLNFTIFDGLTVHICTAFLKKIPRFYTNICCSVALKC